MANYSPVAANVLPSSSAIILRGTAGVAITAGQVVYQYTSGSQTLIGLPTANASTPLTPVGIAVNSAAAGQPISYVAADTNFTPGFATTTGLTTYLSETAGAMCPVTDLVTGDQPVVLLLGTGSATAILSIIAAGVKK